VRPTPAELDLMGSKTNFGKTLWAGDAGLEDDPEYAATKALANYVSEDSSVHEKTALDKLRDTANFVGRETVEFFAEWLGAKRFYNLDDGAAEARAVGGEHVAPPRSWKDHFRPDVSAAATARLRGAAIRDVVGRIHARGHILKEPGVVCIASFPGKYPSAWAEMVRASSAAAQPSTPQPTPKFSLNAPKPAQASLAASPSGKGPRPKETRSVACAFLTDQSNGLGQHTEDPEHKDGRCYCKRIYGERNYLQFGYLIRLGPKHTKAQRLRAYEMAAATNAVVLEDGASESQRAAAEEEAKMNWELGGRRAAWGCKWFQLWKRNIHLAVSRRQQLVVYYHKGQLGKGKVRWEDLATQDDPWDGVGLGGSQRVEVAYLDILARERGRAYQYLEIDVKDIYKFKQGKGLQLTFNPSQSATVNPNASGPLKKAAWATGEADDVEPESEQQEVDDVDAMYTDFSDAKDMLVSPMKWPFFILLQLLAQWPLWIIGKIATGDFVAGLETIAPGSTDLRVNRDCEDLRAEIWRWLTYQWTHAGISHIGFNTFMLLFLGVPLEGFHGHLRFALMFNVGVFGGACCFLVTDAHGPSLIGMSGGCYALLGMHMADIVMNFAEKAKPRRKLMILLLIAVIDFVNVALSQDTNAAASPSHWAHLGGYVAGLLIGIVLGRNLVRRGFEDVVWIVCAIVGTGLACFSIAWALSWPPRDIFDLTPWCWGKQVLSRPHFNDTNYHCVRCDGPNCVADWIDVTCDTCVLPVSAAACKANGGWELSG